MSPWQVNFTMCEKTVIQWHCTPGGLSALFLLPQLVWCLPTPSPSPDQCHTTTTSPLLSTPPTTSPTAIAYFNVIRRLETTLTVWTRFGFQAFCHFLLPEVLTIFTQKTCFWRHCRTQCVSSATAWAQTHQYSGQDCTSVNIQYSQTFNKFSIYSWAAALSHAKVQLDPALACPFQGWCGTGQDLETLPAVTTKWKRVVEPFQAITKPHTRLFNFFPFPAS